LGFNIVVSFLKHGKGAKECWEFIYKVIIKSKQGVKGGHERVIGHQWESIIDSGKIMCEESVKREWERHGLGIVDRLSLMLKTD
jgi:hypothetical protein